MFNSRARSEGWVETSLLQRRNAARDTTHDERIWNPRIEEDGEDGKEPALTLLEEVYLLGLKDREGYTSFWNDSISRGLRGCMLVELGLRGRLELTPPSVGGTSLGRRKVRVKSDVPTGDPLLDEALKTIGEADSHFTVQSWLEYLSGESWNPLKLRYHMKYVKERVAKNLVDKGVLTTDKTSFILFDVTTHPLSDCEAKVRLIKRTQEALLSGWPGEARRMDVRLLCLLMLARAADVLERALDSLSDEDFTLATTRVHHLDDMDLELESTRSSAPPLVWAVFAAYSDITSVLPL